MTMRIPHRKQQYLGCPTVTQAVLNSNCRDRMIPILRGLQHLYSQSQLRQQALDLISKDVLGDVDPDHGRPGMTLWQILVLASVRMGCWSCSTPSARTGRMISAGACPS